MRSYSEISEGDYALLNPSGGAKVLPPPPVICNIKSLKLKLFLVNFQACNSGSMFEGEEDFFYRHGILGNPSLYKGGWFICRTVPFCPYIVCTIQCTACTVGMNRSLQCNAIFCTYICILSIFETSKKTVKNTKKSNSFLQSEPENCGIEKRHLKIIKCILWCYIE